METKELIALEEQLELIGGATISEELGDSVEISEELGDSVEIKKTSSLKLKFDSSALKSLTN